MLKKIFILVFVFISTFVFAHEFWIIPQKSRLRVGETTTLSFNVGEDFTAEKWAGKAKRLLSLTDYNGKEKNDFTEAAIKSDTNDLSISFKTEGTHLLVMQSKNSLIALEADKFNDYLIEDGMEDMLETRKQKGELQKPSRELYQRCAKNLLQVGDKMTNTFKKVVGLPLEIVPMQNPYDCKIGDKLTVKILFQGKALKNKKIFTWHKNLNDPAYAKTRKTQYTTDNKGKVTFVLDQKGEWLVSLVQMIDLGEANKEGNYQSFWASLTFDL